MTNTDAFIIEMYFRETTLTSSLLVLYSELFIAVVEYLSMYIERWKVMTTKTSENDTNSFLSTIFPLKQPLRNR